MVGHYCFLCAVLDWGRWHSGQIPKNRVAAQLTKHWHGLDGHDFLGDWAEKVTWQLAAYTFEFQQEGVLQRLVKAAGHHKQLWASRVHAESDQLWQGWVLEALAKGASRAHRWTRPPQAPTLPVAEQMQEADAQTKFWRKLWTRDHKERDKLLGKLHNIRLEVLADKSRGEYQGEWLDSALTKAKEKSGMGEDQIYKGLVAGGPQKGRDMLLSIFKVIYATMVLPSQFVCVLVVLLGKPDGGWRPIGLMSMLLRWYLASQRWRLGVWDAATANERDYCLAGRGAQAASMCEDSRRNWRRWRAE